MPDRVPPRSPFLPYRPRFSLDEPRADALIGSARQVGPTQSCCAGPVDHRVDSADHLPDPRPEPGGREQVPPLSEFYCEAFQSLWGTMAKHGATELVSGIGGDELASVYDDEDDPAPHPERERLAFEIMTPRAREAARTCLPDRAPPSPIPATSLLAHACRSPYIVRLGLWPVNPLCDRELVRFCHRLPVRHRRGRKPLRRYCEQVLGKDHFPPGYTKETFASVLPDAVVRHCQEISAQLGESILAARGLVDLRAVHALLGRVVSTRDPLACGQLAFFLALERFARQIER